MLRHLRRKGTVRHAGGTWSIRGEADAITQTLANDPENLEAIERMDNVACVPPALTREGLRLGLFCEPSDIMVCEKEMAKVQHYSALPRLGIIIVQRAFHAAHCNARPGGRTLAVARLGHCRRFNHIEVNDLCIWVPQPIGAVFGLDLRRSLLKLTNARASLVSPVHGPCPSSRFVHDHLLQR
jgi:hypothetical protein